MKKTRLVVFLLTIAPTVLLAAIASTSKSNLEALPVRVMVIGDSVHYSGHLDAVSVAKLSTLIKASAGKVNNLVIDSGGGDVNVGMDLAEIVLAAELDVIVKRLCASSCANYVFPAGKRKQITSGSIVIWHGSAIQEGLDAGPTVDDIEFQGGAVISESQKLALLESYREQAIRYVEDAKARQGAFFNKIGVDARITVMGQQLNAAQAWTLSVKDMKRFGVREVSAADDYGHNMPAEISERGIKLLRLDDYPDYAVALDSQTPG